MLSIGLLFGWLLSFPLQGPLLGAFAQTLGIDPQPLIVLFLAGHIVGKAGAGIVGHLLHTWQRRLSWAAAPCGIISLTLVTGPSPAEPVAFAFMGLLSGCAITGWGGSFAFSVPPQQRGRTFVLGALLANALLYAATLLANAGTFGWMIGVASAFPLAMPIALHFSHQGPTFLKVLSTSSPVAGSLLERLRYWPALPFVFAVYVVGGLMYFVVANVASHPEGLLSKFGLMPYMILLAISGALTDIAGRRAAAFTGAIVVGIGFMLVVL